MGCRQFVVEFGWSGPQERSQRKIRSVLVELGRWAHDQETARGRPHHLLSVQPAQCLEGVVRARNRLEDVGFNAPSWEALVDGVRPEANSLGRCWAWHAPAWVAVQGNVARGRFLHVHFHLAPPP